MKKLFVVAPIAIIIIALAAYALLSINAKPYSVSEDGILSYGKRPAPNYTVSLYNETAIAKIYKVVFWSRDRQVYGLLSQPKDASPPYKTFILLPANSIPKEEEQRWLGEDLNKKGYAAFSLDQRGIGETGEVFINANHEFSLFKEGKEPEQFKMMHDALAAFDVLSSSSSAGTNSNVLAAINKSAIYMAGESMGGRVAIISGAMEPRIAGVMGISTGGYGLMENQDYMTKLYLRSVDPDNYVSLLSPRKLLLLHSKGDSIVNVGNAERTFGYAEEPKKLLEDDGQDHGYYRHEKVMTLNEGLEWLVG